MQAFDRVPRVTIGIADRGSGEGKIAYAFGVSTRPGEEEMEREPNEQPWDEHGPNAWRNRFLDIVVAAHFKGFIMLLIVLNTILLMMKVKTIFTKHKEQMNNNS